MLGGSIRPRARPALPHELPHLGDPAGPFHVEEQPVLVPEDAARRLAVSRWLVRNMGIGDGVHRPDRRRREAEEHPLLDRLGGRADLMGNIRWFRDSTQGRQRPAA